MSLRSGQRGWKVEAEWFETPCPSTSNPHYAMLELQRAQDFEVNREHEIASGAFSSLLKQPCHSPFGLMKSNNG